NLVTIVILSRGKCGLSKCVTRYLIAMAAADLLVVILDVILKQLPISYRKAFDFLQSMRMCNIHAGLLHAATDCSVWFTVTFTFDRFVAICCQKLKTKYCTERTAAVVLGTVTALTGLKNMFWCFMFRGYYRFSNLHWFCLRRYYLDRAVFTVLEILHFIFTPCIAFVLILLLNTLTVRHILVASKSRRRLRGPSTAESPRDPEMDSRRKCIISMFVISGNFILLWALYMVHSIYLRVFYSIGDVSVHLHRYVTVLAAMLQLLSCCTNTGIYAVTQTKFRGQLQDAANNTFTQFVKFIKP
uniref:probable G-protein coupled receptor 139 n=1 Tax=Pristiophorus japonicus TaxID=55135 RepID=UPI00398E5556